MKPAGTDGYRALRWILVAKACAGLALTAGFAGAFWLRANGLTLAEATQELRRSPDDPPRNAWRSIDGKHWQAQVSSDPVPPSVVDAREGNNGAGCAPGMVRVKGNFRLELHGEASGEIERIQDAACTDWISREFPARCRTYDRVKMESEIQTLPTRPMDFCIDRFEYPNALGQNPMIVVTFGEAEALCKKDDKRLCSESEWTFACEGEEVRPYPHGFSRDATACVIDRAWRPFTQGALAKRDGEKAKAELDRLWQAEPSGSRLGCKSPFGVYDMTGNVDEWTRSVRPKGHASVMKGGYWGQVRARCRPATRAHDEGFVAYQQGFRCCGEARAEVSAPPPAPAVAAVLDAGPVPATLTAPDGGTRYAAADDALEWTSASDDEVDDDEIRAIEKARVGFSCAALAPRAPAGRRTPDAAYALLAGAGLLVAARARRRPRR